MMLKFRIVNGKEAVQGVKRFGAETPCFLNDQVRIDAAATVVSSTEDQNGQLFCIGDVAGQINTESRLVELDSLALFLTKYKNTKPLHEIAASLEGRFVLVFLDSDGKAVICADKFSKLDVFYQQSTSGVTLSSELTLLPEDPSVGGFDQNALAHMLTYYGYCPPKKHTIYQSVRRLGLNEIAELDNGKLAITEYDFQPQNAFEYKKEEQEKYTQAFLDHLEIAGSNEGNIVYLSSGWDSTSILAGLVKIFGADKVRAVTGRMKYSDRSGVCNQPEIDRAKKMADYFGVKLDIVDFEYIADAGVDFVDGLTSIMKNHQVYSLTAHTHSKLAEKTREIITGNEAVFAGEISDGAHNLGFSQYATIFHPSFGFREYSDKMASYLFGPTFLSLFKSGKHLDDPIYDLFRSRAGQLSFDTIETDVDKRTLQLFTSFFLRNGRLPLWSGDNINLLTDEGLQQYTTEMQESYLQSALSEVNEENIYSWYLHLYNSFHWQGGTVRSLGIMADEYGLKSNLPFWNTNIQQFLSTMPEDWGRGLDLNPTKYPLKSMLEHDIDYPMELQHGAHAYTYDTDHSFNHMEEVFIHSKMKIVFQSALSGMPYKNILSADIFDMEYLDNIVNKYLDNKSLSIPEIVDLVPVALLCYVGWFGK